MRCRGPGGGECVPLRVDDKVFLLSLVEESMLVERSGDSKTWKTLCDDLARLRQQAEAEANGWGQG